MRSFEIFSLFLCGLALGKPENEIKNPWFLDGKGPLLAPFGDPKTLGLLNEGPTQMEDMYWYQKRDHGSICK